MFCGGEKRREKIKHGLFMLHESLKVSEVRNNYICYNENISFFFLSDLRRLSVTLTWMHLHPWLRKLLCTRCSCLIFVNLSVFLLLPTQINQTWSISVIICVWQTEEEFIALHGRQQENISTLIKWNCSWGHKPSSYIASILKKTKQKACQMFYSFHHTGLNTRVQCSSLCGMW